jgi:hypothetical protein
MSVKKLYLFDLDTKLMTSVGPVYYQQQETSSRYCVANDNLCNVRRYCELIMLQQACHTRPNGEHSAYASHHSVWILSSLLHMSTHHPRVQAKVIADS